MLHETFHVCMFSHGVMDPLPTVGDSKNLGVSKKSGYPKMDDL